MMAYWQYPLGSHHVWVRMIILVLDSYIQREMNCDKATTRHESFHQHPFDMMNIL